MYESKECQTLSANPTSDNVPRYYDGLSIRRLTPLECERLQGFPDGWTEGVSDTRRYNQCGNAVTVNVVEQIVQRLLNKEVKSGCDANDDGIPPNTKVSGILPTILLNAQNVEKARLNMD